MVHEKVKVDTALLEVQKLAEANQKLHEKVIGLEHQIGVLRRELADKTSEIHKLRDYETGYRSLRGVEYLLMARINQLRAELDNTTECYNSANASRNRLMQELEHYRKDEPDTPAIENHERAKRIQEFFNPPEVPEPTQHHMEPMVEPVDNFPPEIRYPGQSAEEWVMLNPERHAAYLRHKNDH